MKFEELELDTHLKMAIYENGFVEPTPIQAKAIPLIMEGYNVVGRSETGSGKTLAFLIPILNKINLEEFGVQALIICPTRELALQVVDEARHLAHDYDTDIRVASLTGGMDLDRQRREIKKGAQILVGTIGRILEHVQKKNFMLNKIKTLCLDEADEMLTLGFRKEVEYIMNQINRESQTILFSATFPQPIQKIIKDFVKNPKYVEIGQANTTVENVEQYFIFKKDKIGLLKDLVRTYKDKKILIFANTKTKVEELFHEVKQVTKTAFLHGDIMQNERHEIMKEFRSGITNVLIATDLASRGIDVSNIFLVINFELPIELEYYIHRVGRTARAGKSGTAITIVHNKVSNRKIIELASILGTPIQEMVLHDGKLYHSENTYSPKDTPSGLWDKKTKKQNTPTKSLLKKGKMKNDSGKNNSKNRSQRDDRNQRRGKDNQKRQKQERLSKSRNGKNSKFDKSKRWYK